MISFSQELKQVGAKKMGDFVSNVARLLDETKTKEFNLDVKQGIKKDAYQAKHEITKNMIPEGAKNAYIILENKIKSCLHQTYFCI